MAEAGLSSEPEILDSNFELIECDLIGPGAWEEGRISKTTPSPLNNCRSMRTLLKQFAAMFR